MSINPVNSGSYSWNYSKPDKPGYSPQLVGTVLAIQEVQKMGYTMSGQPGAPQFWPDGNPMMNIRIAIATPEGELKTFTFQPAGRAARMGQKKSVHMDLFALTGNTDMMNLIGKTISIQTQEGHYGQGNPRPWFVQLIDDYGPFKLNMPLPAEFKSPQVFANNAASGGQLNVPQQQYQQYQPAYHQNPMPPQQPAYQYSPQPPQQPQPAFQAQPPMQQYQQPMQGMDPSIAQAMAQQAFGGPVAVTTEPPAQQADPVGNGYVYDENDESMPF